MAALLLLAVGLGDAYGQDGAAGAFARSGFDARGVAMGNALVADATGDASPYYNPALAPFVTRQHISASAAFLTMDREQQYLQFNIPLEPTGGVSVHLIRAAVDNIDARDRSGFDTGTLSTEELSGALTFGNRITDRIALGTSFKFFRADFFEDVSPELSIGIDLGAVIHASEDLQIGLSVNDLLAAYNWETAGTGRAVTDHFPRRFRGGVSYRLLDDQLHLVAEYESRLTTREEVTREPVDGEGSPTELVTDDVRTHDGQARIGASYVIADIFTVRAGLDRIGSGGTGGLRPSAGFGIEQPVGELKIRAAYTFALEPNVQDAFNLLTLKVFI